MSRWAWEHPFAGRADSVVRPHEGTTAHFQWGYLGLMHHHVRAAPLEASQNPQAQIEGVIVDDRPSAGGQGQDGLLLIQRTHTVRTGYEAVQGRPRGPETRVHTIFPSSARPERLAPLDRAASVASGGGWHPQ